MERRVVHIAKMRMIDLAVGDVINRDPESNDGWFAIEEIKRLPAGGLNVTNTKTRNSMTGADNDIVGVQFATLVEFGDENS